MGTHIDNKKIRQFFIFLLLLSLLLLSYVYILQIGKNTFHRLETKKNVSNQNIKNIFSRRMQQDLSSSQIEIILKQIKNRRMDKLQLLGFSIFKKMIFYRIFYNKNEENNSFIEITLIYENKDWKIDQLYFSSFSRCEAPETAKEHFFYSLSSFATPIGVTVTK